MKALITRPREDSGPLVDALRERGIDAVIEPLLTIRKRENARLELDGVQALLLTSANGARAASAAAADRSLPVFAVGDATAREARAHGWNEVESAAGNVEDLARLVAARLKPEAGALLHVAGSAVAGDLVRLLGGFSVRREVLYDADPADAFSPETASLLRSGELDFAFFFSPRTAARFAELARPLSPLLEGATALSISRAAAEPVERLGWQEVRSAAAPNQASLLAALDAVLAGRHDPRSSSKGEAMREPDAQPSGEAPTQPEAEPGSPPAETRPAEDRTAAVVWPVIALVLVLIVVAAAPFIAPALPWGPKARSGASPDEVAALEKRIATLENRPAPAPGVPPDIADRLAKLEQRPQAQIPSDLADRVKRLEEQQGKTSVPPEVAQRLQQLEQRPEPDPAAAKAAQQEAQNLGGTVETLQQRVAMLEAEQRKEASVDRTGQALLLAVTQLRRVAATGKPFAAELGAAIAMAKDSPEIAASLEKLQPLAANGVSTVTQLAGQFGKTAEAIARAGAAPKSEDWSDQILAKLRGLVTIRRVGTPAVETGNDVAVANAEQALAQGDLPAAVAAVETLDGGAKAAAAPWLEAARQRLAVDAALDEADRTLVARLAPNGKN